MNMRIHFKILGGLWLLIGGMLIIGLVVGLWQTWRSETLPTAEVSPFLVFSFVWGFALSAAAIINGWGLLSHKRWARMATIILSSFIFLALGSFFLTGVDDGIEVLQWVPLVMIGLYGLWVMLSKRGLEKRYSPIEKTSSGLKENVASLLCYVLGWVSGLVFILIEKRNKIVRFHAMQSIIVFGPLTIVSLLQIPGLLLTGPLLTIGFVLWVVLMVKAYQGERFKLPWVGNLAERWANKQTK